MVMEGTGSEMGQLWRKNKDRQKEELFGTVIQNKWVLLTHQEIDTHNNKARKAQYAKALTISTRNLM